MILTIGIGNSNIRLGVYRGQELLFTACLRTDLSGTPDEYAIWLREALSLRGCSPGQIEGAILSSVVPQLVSVLQKAVDILDCRRVFVVGPGIKTGVNLKIEIPSQLGTDRVCAAVATIKKYSCPALIIEMGTATTLSVLDKNKTLIGGCIIPGVSTALSALSLHAAQLPHVDLDHTPKSIIANNTVDALRAGSLYGTAAMLDGLIQRHRELFDLPLTVVATGPMAERILPLCQNPIVYDQNLLLDGLKILYDKNAKISEK